MVEAVSARFLRLSLLLAMVALPSAVSAHRLDEYLQAALVEIKPDNVRLLINLTPGMAVAEEVLAKIDGNHDGAISSDEADAYAELLKRDLTVRLDGRKLELKLTSIKFPDPDELRTGEGIIQVEFFADPGPMAPGRHNLTVENRHLPKISVYLLNAAWPSSRSIHITQQKRNDTQSAGQILFTLDPPQRPSKAASSLNEIR